MRVVSALVVLAASHCHATPVRGLIDCLNSEDCVGASRVCYRNASMHIGICVCKRGFVQARENPIRCLSIKDRECFSNLDCPLHLPCTDTLGNLRTTLDGALDDFPFALREWRKTCYYNTPGLEPHTGGGLRSNRDFFEQYYPLDRHDRMASFHPQYMKFVEDAMLVIFLLCVLVTLLVVHRASCYRQIRNSRRNGPLRFILPHRDDQPPPYNYDEADGAAPRANVAQGTETPNAQGCADSSSRVDSTLLVSASGSGVKASEGGRGETPPPTYAEAVVISAAANTPMPLYIALPQLNREDAIATLPPPQTQHVNSTSRTDTVQTSEDQRLVNV